MPHLGETGENPATKILEETRLARGSESAPLEGMAVSRTAEGQTTGEGAVAQGETDNVRADVLAAEIKSGKPGLVRDTEGGVEGSMEESEMSKRYVFNIGVAEFALSQNDMPRFQEAYIKMRELDILFAQQRIEKLDKEFESGNFDDDKFGYRVGEDEATLNLKRREENRQERDIAIKNIKMYEEELEEVKTNPQSIVKRYITIVAPRLRGRPVEEGKKPKAFLLRLARDLTEELRLKSRGYHDYDMREFNYALNRLDGAISTALSYTYKDGSVITPILARLIHINKQYPSSPELQKWIEKLKAKQAELGGSSIFQGFNDRMRRFVEAVEGE